VQPRCSRGAAEVQPRCSRDAAEVQPRCSRDAAEVQPRCSRDAAEMQPRCSRDLATSAVQASGIAPQASPLPPPPPGDECALGVALQIIDCHHCQIYCCAPVRTAGLPAEITPRSPEITPRSPRDHPEITREAGRAPRQLALLHPPRRRESRRLGAALRAGDAGGSGGRRPRPRPRSKRAARHGMRTRPSRLEP